MIVLILQGIGASFAAVSRAAEAPQNDAN